MTPSTTEREQTVAGLKACLALLEHRPQDLVRLYFRADRRGHLQGILDWMASRRLVFREVPEEDLRKLAGGTHHEGVVIAARPLMLHPFTPAEVPAGTWLALDGVENPHNVGALVRTSAFFGVAGVLLGGTEPGGRVNQAVLRVAEGAAERVPLYGVEPLAEALSGAMRQGFVVAGLETDGEPLPGHPLLSDTEPTARRMLVVGGEQAGLSDAVRRQCATVVALPALGELGSLNVSVATGVALAGLTGYFGAQSPAPAPRAPAHPPVGRRDKRPVGPHGPRAPRRRRSGR